MRETDKFWREKFGENYHKRNVELIKNNEEMYKKIFTKEIKDNIFMLIAEFGAGTGQSTKALMNVFCPASVEAIEINEKACEEIKINKRAHFVIHKSILDFEPYPKDIKAQLVVTRGLLIHIHPDDINKAYKAIYDYSNRYILLCEYYNPTLVEVEYRGNKGKLWKRDYFGDIKKMYPDLKLIDYGFVSKYDKYPQDDLTWFLIEKGK